MTDLSVKYLGLNLKNPIIVSSCGLTNSIENLVKIEKEGGAAVVLKSLFEEQIMYETDQLLSVNGSGYYYAEAEDYITSYSDEHSIEDYLNFIRTAKKAVNIPIIASINCVSSAEWTSFAKRIQEAGADALELNISILPASIEVERHSNEKIYFDIIKALKREISMPFSIKIGNYFSALAHTIVHLSWTGVSGIVLFNRFCSPDIDIEKLETTQSNMYSSPGDYQESLRWISLLSDKVYCDMAATTGIHSGNTVIKQLLAGAKAVEIASVLYQNGFEHIGVMLAEIELWMQSQQIEALKNIIGIMSYKNIQSPDSYLRVQFMKHFEEIE